MSRRSFLAAAIALPRATVYDHVDLVELNHFFDGNGKLVFNQVIWWDWSWWHECYLVVAWRICPEAHPWRCYRTSLWVSKWRDASSTPHRMRRVTADFYCETWTQHDPELEDRKRLLPENRRGLS